MADFEDASTPTWMNVVAGQRNMIDAVERTITYDSEVDDRHYALHDEIATLIVRPRGWHLDERHMRVDGEIVSGALVDFGLYMFHNAKRLVDRGSGPYFYLPKLEHHTEAALWNDVFVHAQDALGLDRGTVRATVLVETLPAAFQMEEILHALREHSTGLNAGRWDYIFSTIKCFRDRPEFVTARPPRREDDRAVHARVHGAAGAHVPPPRRARDGRHGRADPVAEGPRGERAGDRRRPGGQEARGDRRLRRHVGRAPRHRRPRARGVRRRPRRPSRTRSTACARTSRSRRATSSTSPRRRARSPRPGCATTSASGSSTSRSGSAAAARRRSTT